MKTPYPFRVRKRAPINLLILMGLLLTTLLVVFLDINWFRQNFESGLGTEMARVALAYHMMLLFSMGVVGVGIAHWVERMIRQKRFIFRCPQKGSWTEKFMNLWGYDLIEDPTPESAKTIPPPEPCIIEPFVLMDLPTRRGRKPTFPLERWLPIAAKWENRDPIRDAFTLGELISEHLGTNSDGSPIVSEQTYYSIWRPRAIEELRRRAKARSPASRQESDQEMA